jgi:hypothetical protein
MYEKFEANRRVFGGEEVDPTTADAITLQLLEEAMAEVAAGESAADDADATTTTTSLPLLVDWRRVAESAAFYRVLPDPEDDPEYADGGAAALGYNAAAASRRSGGRGGGGNGAQAALPPAPPPPASLPDCLSTRDPAAAAALDARARGVIGLAVRGAVVRPLPAEENRWRERAERALRLGGAITPPSSSPPAAAVVLWDADSAPLPADADPRAAACLLRALVEVAGGKEGEDGAANASPALIRLVVYGTRSALARIPAAFLARYAVEGGATTRAAAGATGATSLGGPCVAYYSSGGGGGGGGGEAAGVDGDITTSPLLFVPSRGAQPSLKYALRREGFEVVQVGEASGSQGAQQTKRRRRAERASLGGSSAGDALFDAAERLLRAQARLRARALFEDGGADGDASASPLPPALLLAVVAGAAELEVAGLRTRLVTVEGGGIVPLLVVSGGSARGDGDLAPQEVSWEELLRDES